MPSHFPWLYHIHERMYCSWLRLGLFFSSCIKWDAVPNMCTADFENVGGKSGTAALQTMRLRGIIEAVRQHTVHSTTHQPLLLQDASSQDWSWPIDDAIMRQLLSWFDFPSGHGRPDMLSLAATGTQARAGSVHSMVHTVWKAACGEATHQKAAQRFLSIQIIDDNLQRRTQIATPISVAYFLQNIVNRILSCTTYTLKLCSGAFSALQPC
jgi:hypothetical protein